MQVFQEMKQFLKEENFTTVGVTPMEMHNKYIGQLSVCFNAVFQTTNSWDGKDDFTGDVTILEKRWDIVKAAWPRETCSIDMSEAKETKEAEVNSSKTEEKKSTKRKRC